MLRKAASLLDCTSLGRSAALCGTRITPTYRDAFLGDRSRLTSIRGEPLTFNRANRRSVKSSAGVASVSDDEASDMLIPADGG